MVRTMVTTKGTEFTIDDCDYRWVSRKTWVEERGYIYTHPDDTKIRYSIHRIIMNFPIGMTVDHVDRNPLNNQRSNLRLATAEQNARNRNRSIKNTSGYKGVSRKTKSGKYVASIGFNRCQYNLGSFDTPEDAARAYDTAAQKFHQEFAVLNFPQATDLTD